MCAWCLHAEVCHRGPDRDTGHELSACFAYVPTQAQDNSMLQRSVRSAMFGWTSVALSLGAKLKLRTKRLKEGRGAACFLTKYIDEAQLPTTCTYNSQKELCCSVVGQAATSDEELVKASFFCASCIFENAHTIHHGANVN